MSGRKKHNNSQVDKEVYPALPSEQEIAQRWWMLPSGSVLPLSNGKAYRLHFAGHPGGAAGPDVQDAVLVAEGRVEGEQDELYVGDVEFHVRASDWTAHRHQDDPRYNRVVLHVVLVIDDATPTLRRDGTQVPLCSLYDLPPSSAQPPVPTASSDRWPCHSIMVRLSEGERAALLQRAGLLRFEQKAYAFVEQLHATVRAAQDYDSCLIPALAEALGYGRDRAFFRAAGLHLAGLLHTLPEPLGREPWPAPLDSGRLRVLGDLVSSYCPPGLWWSVRRLLLPETPGSCAEHVLQSLHEFLCFTDLSLARADILLCNVVYPFAAAVALLEHDEYLYEWAKELYISHPGLSSNRITRMMSMQLQLCAEPVGTCRQQGLHYIYQQTCREKRCSVCMMGRNVL